MNFKKLSVSDFSKIKPLFNNQRYRLCVYSLPSLIAWSNSAYYPFRIIEEDSLIVGSEFINRKENRHLILPISPAKIHSPGELHSLATKLKINSYWFIPEKYIHMFGEKNIESFFEISEQKEFNDYIYSKNDLATLKGNRFSKKRNLINQFNKKYVHKGKVTVAPITSDVTEECIDFLEKWCKERGDCGEAQDEDLACEKQAAINTLENFNALQVKGLYLRLDKKISAFGIASHLTDDTGVLHFQKAFSSFKGLYQFFDRECARQLFKEFQYINKESDMNSPGLARAKKSYHPVMMEKSFKMDIK